MKQEDKDLLLKDLCTRLPYGVKCHIGDSKPYTLSSISNDYDGVLIRFKEQKNGFNMEVYLSEVKPYLFPFSSMTEEQREEYNSLRSIGVDEWGDITYFDTFESVDWCNKNHFDYRDLISKDLSIDATGLDIY